MEKTILGSLSPSAPEDFWVSSQTWTNLEAFFQAIEFLKKSFYWMTVWPKFQSHRGIFFVVDRWLFPFRRLRKEKRKIFFSDSVFMWKFFEMHQVDTSRASSSFLRVWGKKSGLEIAWRKMQKIWQDRQLVWLLRKWVLGFQVVNEVCTILSRTFLKSGRQHFLAQRRQKLQSISCFVRSNIERRKDGIGYPTRHISIGNNEIVLLKENLS